MWRRNPYGKPHREGLLGTRLAELHGQSPDLGPLNLRTTEPSEYGAGFCWTLLAWSRAHQVSPPSRIGEQSLGGLALMGRSRMRTNSNRLMRFSPVEPQVLGRAWRAGGDLVLGPGRHSRHVALGLAWKPLAGTADAPGGRRRAIHGVFPGMTAEPVAVGADRRFQVPVVLLEFCLGLGVHGQPRCSVVCTSN